MKNVTLAFIFATTIFAGCSDDTLVSPDVAENRQLQTDAASQSKGGVFAFADPATQVGTSTLIRNKDYVSTTVSTSGMTPGHTMTLWWVAINNPAACEDQGGEIDGVPCNMPDLFNPEVQAAVLYGDGSVVNAAGRASFQARLYEGETPGSIADLLGIPSIGMFDANAAEIHLVVRSHGPAIPGQVEEQLASYVGGCSEFMNPPSVPAAEGECADIQFSIHQP
jgi:hypothetical protein